MRFVLTLMLAAAVGQSVGPSVPVNPVQVFRDVEALAADGMEGRLAGSAGGRKARDYVRDRLAGAGVTPVGTSFDRPFTFESGGPGAARGTNVVGLIAGSRVPERYIVLTAHYDHIGVRNGEVFNGADDNASGVASLLAAAEHFVRSRPAHSLLIAALDAEEAGLHGARAFMRDPPVPVEQMVVNVNMDMVGRDSANRLFLAGVHHYPYLKPYLDDIAQPPVVLVFGHDTPTGDDWTKSSDHHAFHEAGIPFVLFSVENTAYYHKPTDDPSTIDRAFLAGAAGTIIRAVQQLDAHLEEIAAHRLKK